MKDYSIKMQDGSGSVVDLFINADSISELIASGMSAGRAQEEVESNAFANAIYRGEIGADAWAVA
jgi:hypothetical protein